MSSGVIKLTSPSGYMSHRFSHIHVKTIIWLSFTGDVINVLTHKEK